MNEDYLWDRSGEPDAETQELEELLGRLRYQPRPFAPPADRQADRQRLSWLSVARSFTPRLALAASLTIVLLGLGLWLGLRRWERQPAPGLAIITDAQVPSPASPREIKPAPADDSNQHAIASAPQLEQREAPRRRRANSRLAAARAEEGRAAKDQLMLALRLASLKLNFVQKKTLNTNPRDPIQNQHKIG